MPRGCNGAIGQGHLYGATFLQVLKCLSRCRASHCLIVIALVKPLGLFQCPITVDEISIQGSCVISPKIIDEDGVLGHVSIAWNRGFDLLPA